jgi:N-acetylglucosamine malate deacetylase 2
VLNEIPLSRRTFTQAALGATLASAVDAGNDQTSPLKVLAVVAHPDDEYHFAVTLYRIVRELGGVADQLVITDGAGGHRYSGMAEKLYGVSFSGGGARLPDIRRAETAVAGHVIGIRQHFFLDQRDSGFTLEPAKAIRDWDHFSVTQALDSLLETGQYDFIFTLLPSSDTHGHHKAAALLVLEATSRLPEETRPVVLAAEAADATEPLRFFQQLDGHPVTRVATTTYDVSRKLPAAFDPALNYQIIANWVIAAHKSQGLFQLDAGRHCIERFWRFECGGPKSHTLTEGLFTRLGEIAA